MQRTTLLCAMFALAAPPIAARQAPAETEVARRIIAHAQAESRVMEYLDQLVNRIGPRLTGSDGFENACHWARSEFETIGLSHARLERWGEFAVGFNRGPASGRMVAPVERPLRFGTNAWTAGTRGVVRARAILAPRDAAELEALGTGLAGAWVVSRPTPRGAGQRPSPEPREFRALRDKAYDEAGIAGTIRAARGERIVTSGSPRVTWETLPTRPSIQMVADDHAFVVEQIEAGGPVELEFDVRNHFERGPIQLHNVIAELVGTEKPDEYVIVGGHLDSWDGATGTCDNGTGVATTLEAARLLVAAGARPKRTIRFMLWGGEEQGLLGARAWIEANKAELPRISAVLNHDGGTNYCAGIPATEAMVPLFEQVFAPVVDLDPEQPFKIRKTKGISPVGSDSDAYLAAGVPGFFWDQRGRANYGHVHHTQFDTFEQAIPHYQRNSAIVIAVGALGIANLPDLLPREGLRPPASGGPGARRLGVQLDEELRIEELVDGGLALQVGLLVGDHVLAIGDTPVGDREELRAALQAAPTKTTVAVRRGAERLALSIEFPPHLDGPLRRFGLRVGDDLAVERVTRDEAAAKAGVEVGDVVTAVDGRPVDSKAALSAAVAAAQGRVRLDLRRGAGESATTLSVTFAGP